MNLARKGNIVVVRLTGWGIVITIFMVTIYTAIMYMDIGNFTMEVEVKSYDKTNKIIYDPKDGSDQPVHLPIMIVSLLLKESLVSWLPFDHTQQRLIRLHK